MAIGSSEVTHRISSRSNSASTRLATHNVTMSTTLLSTNSTVSTTTAGHEKSATGTIIAAIITVVCIIVILIGIAYMLRRMGKLDFIFGPTLRRRSSTSGSRRPLEEEEDQVEDHAPNDSLQRDDMFTIDDLEEDEFGSQRMEGEGYFYDEVFSPSQFQDERTQNSVRRLVSERDGHDAAGDVHHHADDDELLDFDFETLGIKIDDYKIDPSREHKA